MEKLRKSITETNSSKKLLKKQRFILLLYFAI